MAQHGLAALLLILAGYDGLISAEHHTPILPIFQLLIGTALIAAIIVEKFRKRHEENIVFPVVDSIAAVMLILEGLNRTLEGKHFIQYLYYFIGLMTFIMAFYYPRISLRRHFRLDQKSLFFRISPFKSIRIPWKNIRTMTFDGQIIMIQEKDVRKFSIELKKTYDNNDVCRRIFEYALSRGLDREQLVIKEATSPEKPDQAEDLLPSSQ